MKTASACLLLPVVVFALILFRASTAFAGCTVPFTVNLTVGHTEVFVACSGPWSRQSRCVQIPSNVVSLQFYCAYDTLFSMYGDGWNCALFNRDECDPDTQLIANVDFCLQQGRPNAVDLRATEMDNSFSITSNAPATCASVETIAHLGHAGAKSSKTVDRSSAPGDRDTFVFDGSEGEKITVALEKEGTAGHTGDAAVLRVLANGGTTLDEVSGPLPLELAVELPATGNVQVVVEEAAHRVRSDVGAPSDAFRGHYLLSVTPDRGTEGLLLEPQPDVEP